MNSNWLNIANDLNDNNESFVMVTVLGLRGSAPVKIGQRFIVTEKEIFLTLGGGKLEQEAINHARECILENKNPSNLSTLSLGSKLGQCCGGNVVLHYEIFNVTTTQINIFGAGHVAQELVRILMRLPYQINCIDSRKTWINKLPKANNVNAVLEDDLVDAVVDLKPNSFNLIMTHRHDLDLAISEQLLKVGHFPLVGVIGSNSKATRFKQQLKNKNINLDAFVCPIGDMANKDPVSVAIMIAAKLCKEIAIEKDDQSLNKEANRLLAQLAKIEN